MLRGTCYRDMSETDPDFPEQFRIDIPPSGVSLQRVPDSFSLDGNNSDDQGQPQPMSDDTTPDWAEQMQRDSAEKLAAQNAKGTLYLL